MLALIVQYSIGLVQAIALLVTIMFASFHRKNRNASTIIYFVIISCFHEVQTHGNGAPNSRCDSMTPGHWVSPQKSLAPYQILVDKTLISPGDRVNITLKTIPGQTGFKGFFVMVKEVNADSGSDAVASNNKNYGVFDLASSDMNHAQPVHCFEQRNSAMTHAINYVKDSVELSWIAPNLISEREDTRKQQGQKNGMEKELKIVATFVRDFWTYWADVKPAGDATLLLIDIHQPHGQQFSPKFQTPSPTQTPPIFPGTAIPVVPEYREGASAPLNGDSSWDHFKRAWNFMVGFFGSSSSSTR